VKERWEFQKVQKEGAGKPAEDPGFQEVALLDGMRVEKAERDDKRLVGTLGGRDSDIVGRNLPPTYFDRVGPPVSGQLNGSRGIDLRKCSLQSTKPPMPSKTSS